MAPRTSKPKDQQEGQQQAPQQETILPGQEASPPPPPPPSESDRVKTRKLQVIKNIQTKCSDPIWLERLLKIAHDDESKIMRAVNSFSTFIANDQGSGKGIKQYICDASIPSLFSCFLEAFQMGLEIGGGRDLVSIIVYTYESTKTAELEVTYKGFVHALNKHFDNAYVQPGLIFTGDEFDCEISDTKATFKHKPKKENLLSQTWAKLEGSYCYFSYTQRENKETVSRLIVIDKKGIEMIRSKAKQQGVWNDFWDQQTLKSTIRRASKIPFAQIDFGDNEVDLTTIDNRHFLLEDKSGGTDRLGALMKRQQEVLDDDNEKPPIGGNKSGAVDGGSPTTTSPEKADDKAPGTASQPARGGEGEDGSATAGVPSGVPQSTPAASPEQNAGGSTQQEGAMATQMPPDGMRFTESSTAAMAPVGEALRPELTDDDFEEK